VTSRWHPFWRYLIRTHCTKCGALVCKITISQKIDIRSWTTCIFVTFLLSVTVRSCFCYCTDLFLLLYGLVSVTVQSCFCYCTVLFLLLYGLVSVTVLFLLLYGLVSVTVLFLFLIFNVTIHKKGYNMAVVCVCLIKSVKIVVTILHFCKFTDANMSQTNIISLCQNFTMHWGIWEYVGHSPQYILRRNSCLNYTIYS